MDSAPGTLNTLNELAAALGDDANFSTTITNSLATKVGLTATTGAASIPAGTTAQRPGSPAAGQFRYNSTLNQFEGYTSSWGAIGGGGTNTFTTDVFTGDGSTTAYTLSQAVSSVNDCIVHVGGIYQVPTDAYTVSGTTLTFTSAPANTRKIVVYSVKAGVSGNNLNVQTFSGDGSATSFTMSVNPVNENNTIVHIDGVYQQKTSYSTSGTTLSFSAAPANGTTIEVATFTQTEINVPVNDTIDTVHIKDDAVTSAKLGGNLVAPGTVTASAGFVGPLTGNVTGNVSGSAATVTGAAQTNITSVGTLTGLATSGSVGFRTTADSNYALKLLQSQSLTHGGYFQINGGSAIGLEVNATSGSYSGTALYVRESSVTSGGYLARFANSAGDKMVVETTGNVGIGISSPSAPLDVVTNSTVWAGEFTQSNTSNGDGVIVTVGSTASADYALSIRSDAGNTGAFNVKADGNVGIGTFSPSEKLVLKGDGARMLIESADYELFSIGRRGSSGAALDDAYLRMKSAGTNTIVLDTDGNTYFNGGNVGIGTNNPNQIFHIKNTGQHTTMRIENDNADFLIQTGDAGDDGLHFYDNANTAYRMTIDNAGQVGIGTTNPTQKLDVRGGSGAGTLTHAIFTGTSSRGLEIRTRSDTSGGQNSGTAEINSADSEGTGGDLAFSSNGNVRMFIDGGGNVGIGESNPARRLSVRRDTGITAGFNDISQFLDTTLGAGGSVSLNLGRANSSKNLGKMAFKYAGSGSNSNALNFGFYDADNLMTLLANGKVGIGTSNPTEALEVAGSIKITGSSRLLLPNFWIGAVPNTANNNNGAVLLVNLTTINANNVGFQFSGSIIGNSYTGQAFINANIVKHYSNDAVGFDVGDDQNLNSTVTRMQLRLCTVTYSGNSYLAIVKVGGGTGTIFLNGYFQGWYPSQVTEVASGTYTVTTNHGNLNF